LRIGREEVIGHWSLVIGEEEEIGDWGLGIEDHRRKRRS
jgi:hypothetical protein